MEPEHEFVVPLSSHRLACVALQLLPKVESHSFSASPQHLFAPSELVQLFCAPPVHVLALPSSELSPWQPLACSSPVHVLLPDEMHSFAAP